MKVSAETGAAVRNDGGAASAVRWLIGVLTAVVVVVAGLSSRSGEAGMVLRLRAEAPDAFNGSGFERVSALRDWAYPRLDQAGDYESYRYHSIEGDSPEVIFGRFARDEDLAICGNMAVALRNLYLHLGYRAWTLDMGTPGAMTHVVTLVEVDGRIVVQDAYYGGSFGEVDVREVISAVAGGGRPEWVEGDVEARDYVTAAGIVERVWRVADDADHPLWGGPPDFHRLFLLPLNVTGEGDEALEAELRAAARTGSLPT